MISSPHADGQSSGSGTAAGQGAQLRAGLRLARRGLWHLRTGGPTALAEFISRSRRPAHRATIGRPETLFAVDGSERSFQPWPWPQLPPRRTTRVGIIADPFTLSSFRYEWDQVELTPEGWADELDGLDLVFVESAWAGNGKAWQYHLTGSSAPRPAVVELLAACRERGLPTVFWNKEDPTHFEDFLETARLCDWVFTTDQDCVPRYAARLGHERVGVLPFAVPERVCNPARPTREHQPLGIAFAGTWFAHKYPERREQMRLLFDAARQVASDEVAFEIYSRFQGVDDRYEFPEPYASHVVGSLDYDRMLSAYRSYKVFLNVNTVTSSATMCARRVLEITACGTPVVSTPAPSLAGFLGEGVVQVSEPQQAREAVGRLVSDPWERARLVHLGQRRLWQEHTYGHRVDQVLDRMGLPNPAPVGLPAVSVLASTNRPGQVQHLLEQFARQADVSAELLVGTHGFEATDLRERASALGIEHLTVLPLDSSLSLGECLNALAERASGQVFSKMDDDDRYGPQYLADLLRAMHFSDAQIVGKQCRFVELAAHGKTLLLQPENEHRYTNFVAGPTLTWLADLGLHFAELTRGEDSNFLDQAAEAGARIYASDRFNFVQYRSGDPARHTWTAEDEAFLERGHPVPENVAVEL